MAATQPTAAQQQFLAARQPLKKRMNKPTTSGNFKLVT